MSRNFRDPHYQRDHPVHGQGGRQFIYRFGNGYGAVVDLLFTQPGLHLQPVEFEPDAVEVTSYKPLGECHRQQTEEQIEKRLEIIEALVRRDIKLDTPHVIGLHIEART